MLNPRSLFALVFCHMLTGSASVATRYLVGYLDPLHIAFLRYLLGGLCMLPLVCLARRPLPPNGNLLFTVFLGVLFFAIFPWLHATAFQYTTASRGAIVLATMPIWALLLGYFLGGDSFTPRRLCGIVLAVAGVAAALYDKSLATGLVASGFRGELIMLSAAICGAVYSVFSKPVLEQSPAFLFTPIAMLSGCLFLSPLALPDGAVSAFTSLPLLPLAVMLFLGIMAGGFAFFLFNWVLDKTTPTITTLFVTLNPVTAIVLAWWLLDEAMTPYFYAGAIMVICGIVMTLWPQQNRELSI